MDNYNGYDWFETMDQFGHVSCWIQQSGTNGNVQGIYLSKATEVPCGNSIVGFTPIDLPWYHDVWNWFYFNLGAQDTFLTNMVLLIVGGAVLLGIVIFTCLIRNGGAGFVDWLSQGYTSEFEDYDDETYRDLERWNDEDEDIVFIPRPRKS